jgi:hypothetical protein
MKIPHTCTLWTTCITIIEKAQFKAQVKTKLKFPKTLNVMVYGRLSGMGMVEIFSQLK